MLGKCFDHHIILQFTFFTMSAETTSSLVRGHTPPFASVAATTDMILHVAWEAEMIFAGVCDHVMRIGWASARNLKSL